MSNPKEPSASTELDTQLDEILDYLASECWREGTNDSPFKETEYWVSSAKQALTKLIEIENLKAQQSLIARTEQVDDEQLRAYLRDKEYDIDRELRKEAS